jgi:hypothetical protein
MFLEHANPDTNFRFEEREKCDVLYPGSGLLHDHVGRFVLVLKKGEKSLVLYPGSGLLHDHVGRFVLVELVGLQDAARLRLVPRQHQGHLA